MSFHSFTVSSSLLRIALSGVGVLLIGTAAMGYPPPDGEPRVLEAHPLSAPLSVDGRLDEADWQSADVATGFVQLEPSEGEPASERTEVRVIYGPSALYIGAILYDDPERVRRPLTRRDNVGNGDYFLVSIDAAGTGRSAFLFGVTAAGVQIDATEERGVTDYSWDAVWDSAVRLGPDGWVVEMEIPYSMLRFPRRAEQSWGIQLQRRRAHSGETVYWQPVRREEMGVGVIAGRLVGLGDINPRPSIQIRPYTLSRVTRAPEAGIGPTYAHDGAFDVGTDFKMSWGSNLVFDATINPDFGQAEADPEVLNLSTFETFFQERRPFFLEGTSIFDYNFAPGDGQMLYTRRVGSRGRIVGAGKLTGTTPSGLSFGVLTATTGDGLDGPVSTGEDFEPNLMFGAARVKREFGQRSYVGGALTYYDGFGADREWDHVRSVVAGADLDYRLGGGSYRLTGALTVNHREFGEYYQLPSRRDFGVYAGMDRIRGVLTGGLSVRAFSEEFNPNHMGFFRENDVLRTRAWAQRLLNGGRPFGPFRLAVLGGSADQKWTYTDQANLGLLAQWSTWWYFSDYQRVSVRGSFVDIGGVDVRESRGLGPVRNFGGAGITFDYSTDTRKSFVFDPRTSFGIYEHGGTAWNMHLNARWTASDRLSLSWAAMYERRDRVQAWVANEAFRRTDAGFALGEIANRTPGAQSTFIPLDNTSSLDTAFQGVPPTHQGDGTTDYFVSVFGSRAQRIVDTSARATYTFRPNLSLQLYSQLFAARFRFDDFRLLAGSHDLRHLETYPRRRDANRRSLNTNVVLRWEYRPGSTLFAVWSHGRLNALGGYVLDDPDSEYYSPFDRGTFGLALDTFELQPTNVLLLKLNYLLMR
jgi:hypothetical protein